MLLRNKLCIDAGTVNCPCHLAEYGKCLVCSRLGGSGTRDTDCICAGGGCISGSEVPGICGCQWHGVCIYNEYLQNNLCIKEQAITGEGNAEECIKPVSGEQRQSVLCGIQKIKWFEDDLAVMRISVPRGIAEKAALPGSFVFAKSPGMDSWFDFPLSVMRADYEGSAIELAVKVDGPKSKALMEKYRNVREDKLPINDGCVELRGIYRNGMIGVEKLMREFGMKMDPQAKNGASNPHTAPNPVKQTGKRVLCLTKGVGLAPVSNYIRWAGGRDSIDVIADLDKINREFAEYALDRTTGSEHGPQSKDCFKCGINSVTYGPLPLNLSWAEQEKYDVIIISASEYYQQNIYVPEGKKVLSNNTSMCCGEGVCGACICIDADGTARRMCKECGRR